MSTTQAMIPMEGVPTTGAPTKPTPTRPAPKKTPSNGPSTKKTSAKKSTGKTSKGKRATDKSSSTRKPSPSKAALPRKEAEQLRPGQTWCTAKPDLFLAVSEGEERDRRQEAQARDLCQKCPLFVECLQGALVGPEVAGFVAGTTDKERTRMRHILNVTQRVVDPGSYAGVIDRSHRDPVDHVRLAEIIKNNPDASRDQIAEMAGCSNATVKRHIANPPAIATGSAPGGKQADKPSTVPPAEEPLRQVFTRVCLKARQYGIPGV